MRDWRIEVRDKTRARVGQLDDFQSLDMTLKWNDVSTWQLVVDRRNRLAADLLADNAGIIVYRDDAVMLSGYWTEQDHVKNKDTNRVTVIGVDDTDWLNRRETFADPNDIVPPYNTQVSDIRTGQASTIIRQFVDENGGLATPVARRISGLFAGVEVDPFVGPTVTGTGRWQMLLPLCQELAATAEAQGQPVGFKIIQSGTDLLFSLTAPADKSGTVRFSFELGNLAAFTYKRTRPSMTYAIVGGNGEGTARTMYEKPNSPLVASWGRIEGDLVDARNGDSANELSQAADKALAEGAGTTSLAITPIDLPNQTFGVDYNLGDKVTVLLDSVGPLAETDVADAVGQGTSATADYLIAFQADAIPFVNGTRVRIRTSNGLPKDPGVRVVVDQATAFGYTNIYFSPLALVSTVAGDHLVAVEAPQTQGEPIVDLVREVNIHLTSDGGARVTPAVGSTTTKINPSRVFAVLRDMKNRLRNLERR